MSSFSLTLQPLLSFVSNDPMLRLIQGGLLLAGSLVIFLLFFATRDIILRTRSFLYQFACILLVAALPVVGFLLYMLIRPARTVKERQMEAMLKKILETEKVQKPQQNQNIHQNHQQQNHQKQQQQKKVQIARSAAAKATSTSANREKQPLEVVAYSG